MTAETLDSVASKKILMVESDEPISIKEKDRLGMWSHACALARVVQDAPKPFTIALQGQWGCGKTSLMNLMYNLLCEEKKDKKSEEKFCGVYVSAWKCALAAGAPDEAASRVLDAIRDKIKEEEIRVLRQKRDKLWWLCTPVEDMQRVFKADVMDMFRNDKDGIEVRIKDKLGDYDVIGLTILGYGVIFFIFAIISLIVRCLKILWTLVAERKQPRWMKKISGSERNAALALKALGELLQDGVDEFRKEMEDSIQICKKNGKKGVAIFVDDLDRLEPEYAVKTLDALKNLLVIGDCVLVLAIAYDVVEKGLRNKFDEKRSDEQTLRDYYDYRSYFDKIIQLPFHVPVEKYRIEELLKDGLIKIDYFDDAELEDNHFMLRQENILRRIMDKPLSGSISRLDCIKFAVQVSTGWNPRSVKRLIYLLSLVDAIYVENNNVLGKQNEKMSPEKRYLCFILICVQIAYHDIYKKLLLRPDFTRWRPVAENNVESSFKPSDKKLWIPAVSQAVRKTALERCEKKIITLLQLMECCMPSAELGGTMEELMSLVAIAGGDVVEQQPTMEREEFLSILERKNLPSKKLKIFKGFLEKMDMVFADEVSLYYKYDEAGVRVYLNSCGLMEWQVDAVRGALPYTFVGEGKPSEIKPLDTRFHTEDVWKNMLTVYNDEVPEDEKLPADFVEKRWETLWPSAAERGAAS